MQVRSMLPFLVLVSIVSIVGAVLAMQMIAPSSPQTITQLVTVPVIITATTDPFKTPDVIIITATFDVNRTQVAVPTDIAGQAAPTLDLTRPTLDVEGALELNPSVEETAAALPANCLLHTIQEGEAPFAIAVQYGANPFLLLDANGLTEETSTQLQIGQTLIIPLEGCPVEDLPTYRALSGAGAAETPTATGSAEATSEATSEPGVTPSPAPSPTITLAPTAANAQIQIVGIEKAGDVTAEGVRIRNAGNTVDVTGWILRDIDGNEYTFGEQLIFSNTEVTIYTRAGQNTPIALHWGLDKPVWQRGDVITLRDERGQVQATLRVENASSLPQG